MNDITIGRCGNCGGNVTVPVVSMSTKEEPPTCQKCGSTVRNTLPPLPMNPRPIRDTD